MLSYATFSVFFRVASIRVFFVVCIFCMFFVLKFGGDGFGFVCLYKLFCVIML